MPRSAQCLPISFDFRPKFPATGTIHPPNRIPAGKNFQSVEESSRYKPLHRPKTSSHWNNPPAKPHPSGQKLPVGGRILPIQAPPPSKNLQSLEESSHQTASQRAKPSSHWKNQDGQLPPCCTNPSSEWEKRTVKRNRAQIRRNRTCDYSAALMSCAKRAFHMAPVALITAFAPASRYAL